jgi:hypothetical protein
MSDDLKQDLQLVSQNRDFRISADEETPESRPREATRIRKAAGPQVVRTKHPTVKASAKPQQVAEADAPAPPVEVAAAQTSAPAPTTAPAPAAQPDPAPPLARPTTMPGPQSYPGDGSGRARGDGPGEGSGASAGGAAGAILGAILRGAVIGDDHCDPRAHRGSRGIFGGIIGGIPLIRGGGYPLR